MSERSSPPGGCYVRCPFPVRPVAAGEPLAAWVKERIRLHDQRLRWAGAHAAGAALGEGAGEANEMSPTAYEMRDGAAVPCTFYGYERRRTAAPSPPLWPTPRMSKRETRRAARAGGKRLRFWAPGTPVRRPVAPFRYVPPEFVRDIAHRLSDGTREVVLYLPDDEYVRPEHSKALARALTLETSPNGPAVCRHGKIRCGECRGSQ